MTYPPQHFTAPDGTAMVVLTADEYSRLLLLAAAAADVTEAEGMLARIESGEGAMPGAVLASILDDRLSPLAAWRRYRGLTQAELGRQAGLSQVWISRVEGNGGYLTPQTRRKLADVLDAPLWALDDPPG